MKKKLGFTILATQGIIYLVLNVILFIIIKKAMPQQLKNGVFWFVWSMTFVFNALVNVGVLKFYKSNSKYDDVTVPPLIYLMVCFNAAYLVLGLIFMFIPKLPFTVALIFELILTAAYALLMIYYFGVVNYMKSNSAAPKVLFIRSLYVDVDHAIQFVEDDSLKAKMQQLSEDIRFSDPMSKGEVIQLDEALQSLIQQIVVSAMEKNFDAVNELVDKASVQLKYRNAKCRMLK